MVTLQMPIQQLQGPRESENERRHWNLEVRWNLKLRKTLMGPPPLASASHESAATAKVLSESVCREVGCKKMHTTSRSGMFCELSSRSMFDSLRHLTRVSSFDHPSYISLFLDLFLPSPYLI